MEALGIIDSLLETKNGSDPSGPIEIDALHLAICVIPLIFVGFLSVWLGINIHGKLAIAVLRCAAQLSILGWILVPIFVSQKIWMTAAYCFFMLLVAASEAAARPSHTFSGMMFASFMGLGLSCSLVITFALCVVIGVEPFYDPQYLIPLLGMLLGNACSMVSVGLTTILNEFAQNKDSIEVLLAMGATRWEATSDVTKRSLQVAMTPLLNTMNVVGIVSIPGMMTGQILGGSDPSVAAQYQIALFYFVGVSSSLSAIATVYAAVLHICDSHHRLKTEKLLDNSSKNLVTATVSGISSLFSTHRIHRNTPMQEPLLGNEGPVTHS